MRSGTSILITGGTGSFGQAFTERLLRDGLATRICIYSRSEHVQAAMRHRFGDNDRLRFFIGDIRDRWRLCRACDGVDTIVHAAALKRIEVGHYNPSEMVQTNVLGAMNVIEAARDAKVKKVVALSTDKACEPISPYGYCKALAESLFLAADHPAGGHGPRFAITRYGNVWRSAGSVVPTWQQQLEDGNEFVRITDGECTRFFMRMDEAVDLVLATISTMKGGEINVPDLPAYRLGDLATAMGIASEVEAEQSTFRKVLAWIAGLFGRRIKKPPRAVVIGLPVWEKKHESMLPGKSSDLARRMTIEELKDALHG